MLKYNKRMFKLMLKRMLLLIFKRMLNGNECLIVKRGIVGRELHFDSAKGLSEGAFKTTPTATAAVCAVLEFLNNTS